MLQLSQNGKLFTQGFESCELERYLDTAGNPSIGWGHRIKPGEDYSVITRDQADAIFVDDMAPVEWAVNDLVKVSLNQNQFDALCDFAYNVGTGNFEHSTLLKLLNQGEYLAAANQLPSWIMAGGMPSEGLQRRRNAERNLFLSPMAASN